MKPLFSLLLAAAALVAASNATAEKADRGKPMNVEADALRYDDLKQTSVFSGRVVITKGTIVIRGARVEVRQDPEGYQYGTVTAEPGKLAFWRQKRDGGDEWIEGEAEAIDYDGKADRVRFSRRAEIRRYAGASLQDETAGNLIVYENASGVFSVDGATPGTASGSTGRVRAVLGPRGTASAPAAPASAASAPNPLRSSLSLGGERRP